LERRILLVDLEEDAMMHSTRMILLDNECKDNWHQVEASTKLFFLI